MPSSVVRAPSPLGTSTPYCPSPPSLNESTSSRKRKTCDLSPVPPESQTSSSQRRSPFRRSPFKELANVMKGLRKKDKGECASASEPEGSGSTPARSFVNLDDDSDWFAAPIPIGAAPRGLFSSSDDEKKEDDPNVSNKQTTINKH
jgi:hypothetical protein